MAMPVEHVHLAVANGKLPGLLATLPPKDVILPAEAVISPETTPTSSSNKAAMRGRADAAERWDANKTKSAASPSPSPSSKSGSWRPLRSPASISGRAPSCDRWDSNKKKRCRPSSAASCSSSSSSEERWDLHKKPRAHASVGGSDCGRRERTTNDKMTAPHAGMGFLNSPEPCMLPVSAALMAVVPPYAGPGFLNAGSVHAPNPGVLGMCSRSKLEGDQRNGCFGRNRNVYFRP